VNNNKRRLSTTVAVAVLAIVATAVPVGADTIRSRGSGQHFHTSWTEYDPDDILGLPGNVHIGYLSAWTDQYGTYSYGGVTDFECDPGESPWGGHGVVEAIVEEADQVAKDVIENTVDEIVDSGASVIDPDVVVEAVKETFSEAVPAAIEEEVPACDYIQDRFLDGTGTLTYTVNTKNQVATITGTVTVTGGHGGHGEEPGPVLGQPPVNLTMTGGEWQGYEWSNAYWGEGYRYFNSQKGTDIWGASVSGSIGAMGFDDDADDQAYGGFGSFMWQTEERIRG